MSYRDADYCTSAELAAYLRIDDSDDDVQLALAVEAASRAVDRACGRGFGLDAAVVTRDYKSGLREWSWTVDDIASTTGLIVKSSTSWDGQLATLTLDTDFELRPLNAAADGVPWESIRLCAPAGATRLQVTATFGWAAVPDTIKLACLVQASRFFKRREAPFGVAGSPDLGSELRLLAKVDPDVELMLAGYRRRWAAV